MIRLNCKTSCTPNHEQNTWSRIQVVSCIKIFFAAYVLCMDRRHRKCSLTLKPLELGLCVSRPGCSWTCVPSAFFLIFGSSFFFCLLLFLFFFLFFSISTQPTVHFPRRESDRNRKFRDGHNQHNIRIDFPDASSHSSAQ